MIKTYIIDILFSFRVVLYTMDGNFTAVFYSNSLT